MQCCHKLLHNSNIQNLFSSCLIPLSANPKKWSNTLKQFVGKKPTNCLSVFDHFVGLALKVLMFIVYHVLFIIIVYHVDYIFHGNQKAITFKYKIISIIFHFSLENLKIAKMLLCLELLLIMFFNFK